jgi:nucleotide-binding universal stress UspA family protein
MPGITVGVDGSHSAQHALEWAVNEAALRRAPLTVLTVNEVAISTWTGTPIRSAADQPETDKIRQAAEEATQQALGQLGDRESPSVTVRAVSGNPAKELIDASRESDLLVVGSRGGGGFTRLLLGSVSNHVVHYAACPVVVIPHER